MINHLFLWNVPCLCFWARAFECLKLAIHYLLGLFGGGDEPRQLFGEFQRSENIPTCIAPNHPALSSIELELSHDLSQPLTLVARMSAKA